MVKMDYPRIDGPFGNVGHVLNVNIMLSVKAADALLRFGFQARGSLVELRLRSQLSARRLSAEAKRRT